MLLCIGEMYYHPCILEGIIHFISIVHMCIGNSATVYWRTLLQSVFIGAEMSPSISHIHTLCIEAGLISL